MRRIKTLLVALTVLVLGGCGDDQAPLVVGGKNFAENMIVAEMIAALAEDAGLPVARRIGLGSTRLTLEALKRGDIDVYPEYNGTGLVMLGQPPISDGDEATARVRELFAPLGLSWGDRLGFSNDYAIAMQRQRAAMLGVETISDLHDVAGNLRFGIEDDFRTRPLDGFDAFVRRYGLSFGSVVDVPLDERPQLYDRLIDGEVDVILVYATDGQIADFDLVLLADDLDFFPVYDLATLYRDAAVERFPGLPDLLDRLGGVLDVETMRRLNNRVAVLGEDPSQVARTELARLGLIDGVVSRAAQQPLIIAVSPSAQADGEAAAVLRATRRAFPGRNVTLEPSFDPLGAVADGDARAAMVGAPAFFATNGVGSPELRPGFQAVGLIGNTFLHVFALDPDVQNVRDAATIATSAVGSTGHRAAETVIAGLDLEATIVAEEAEDADSLAAAILASGADAAMLMQPLGNGTVRQLLESGATLLPITGWEDGNNRIVYPYLQPARLTAADYAEIGQPVETLAAQLVVAGPAPREERGVGDQGPGASFIPTALPIQSDTVRTLHDALGQTEEIHPILPQSAALAPAFPNPPAAINPAPDVSILTVVVIALLIWMAWLLFRPEYR
jgi:glycine betaine/choline ABC-type transport system substrate-binding protein